jgi:acyl dehydratase
MMLDKNLIGHEFPPYATDVEKGRLMFFAKAIGETNPIYTDETAARDAGYRALPAPPTMPFVLDMEGPELLPVVGVLGLDIARVLHGSQEFEYHESVCAGDRITVSSRIADIFDKKGGALEFVVTESSYTNQNGDLVAQARNTLVYRN